jgi:hypothetical protein
MTSSEAESFLKSAVKSKRADIQRHRDALAQAAKVRKLLKHILKLPSAKDLQYYAGYDPVYPYSNPGNAKVSINLFLRQGAEKSTLLREIVAAGLTTEIKKSKAGDSLTGQFNYLDAVRVNIHGYVPQTCRIEEKQAERILADAYVDAGGIIRQKYVEKVVVCTDKDSQEF